MKGSRKSQSPQELQDWLALPKENWSPTYKGLDAHVRRAVTSALYRDQRGLCVYCGRELELLKPGETHIEHFRPQYAYGALDVDYANLFLSCGQKDRKGLPSQTCGTFKDDWFSEEKHVEPNYPACTQRFRFMLEGEVKPADPDDAAALEMIARLNLNHPELVKERQQYLVFVDGGKLGPDDFWDEETQTAGAHGHMVYQHLGQVLP